MRIPLALIAATATALVIPAFAGGAKPEKVPLPFEPFTIEGSCDFPVAVDALQNKAKGLAFANGVFSVTGKFFVRLTNTESGETLDLNISGPVRISSLADGDTQVVLRGRSLIFLFETDAGGPALLLTSGRVVEVLDEEGNVLSFEGTGRSVDACALLS